jgi:hypothetical protein
MRRTTKMKYEIEIRGTGSMDEIIKSLTNALEGVKGLKKASDTLQEEKVQSYFYDNTLRTKVNTVGDDF